MLVQSYKVNASGPTIGGFVRNKNGEISGFYSRKINSSSFEVTLFFQDDIEIDKDDVVSVKLTEEELINKIKLAADINKSFKTELVRLKNSFNQ